MRPSSSGGLVEGDLHLIALLDFRIDLLRLVRADLRVRIAHDVDDFLADVAQTETAADLGARIDLARLVQRPLGLRILDLVFVLDDFLDDPDDDGPVGAVELGLERLARLVVLARGGRECVFQRLVDAIDVDRLLVRQRFDVSCRL